MGRIQTGGRHDKKAYTDEAAVAETAKEAGYTAIFKQSLITIIEMEKLMGKEKFNELLGVLVEKPKGKLTLVSEADKRRAVDSVHAEFQVEA